MTAFSRFVTRQRSSDFVRHIGVYASGVTLAQLVTLLLTPVLSRLYTPETFGAFAVYSSLISICSIFITLRYEQAILLPDSDADAIALAHGTLLLAGGFVIFLTLAAWGVSAVAPSLNFFSVGWEVLMLWLPLGAFLGACNACLTEWLVRIRAFGAIGRAAIIQAVVNAAVALSFIFLLPVYSRLGLVAALLLSLICGTGTMLVTALKAQLPQRHASLRQTWGLLWRYRKFPAFSLPGDFINSLASQLPLLLISRFFGLTVAGNLSMAVRLLYVPSRFIGKAVRDVFRQRAAQDARGPGGCRAIFVKSGLLLGAGSLVVMLPVIVAGPQLFAFVLGEQWREAGQMARIISPMVALAFVTSPLGWLTYLYEKQHVDLLWQVGLLLSCGAAGIVGYLTHDVWLTVGAWSLGGTLLYLVYLYINFRLSGLQIKQPPAP